MAYRSAKTGRYISKGAAARNKSGSVKESGSNSSSGTHYRSAATGKFVTKATAVRHPNTTLKEQG